MGKQLTQFSMIIIGIIRNIDSYTRVISQTIVVYEYMPVSFCAQVNVTCLLVFVFVVLYFNVS